MARDSSLAAAYIDTGYTVDTFLRYELRGKAKQYSGHYRRALVATLERWQADGRAFPGPSVSGTGTAYYSRPQAPRSPAGVGLL